MWTYVYWFVGCCVACAIYDAVCCLRIIFLRWLKRRTIRRELIALAQQLADQDRPLILYRITFPTTESKPLPKGKYDHRIVH